MYYRDFITQIVHPANFQLLSAVPIYKKPSSCCRRVVCVKLKSVYCSRSGCTSSLSLGRWFITMLQRISAERLS